jgi:hypothetical protein
MLPAPGLGKARPVKFVSAITAADEQPAIRLHEPIGARCRTAECCRRTDADQQHAGEGRPEPAVVGRVGTVADHGKHMMEEVAHEPGQPQHDRPHCLDLPRETGVDERSDGGENTERDDAVELEAGLHPDDQVVDEMRDHGRGGEAKKDALGSHPPFSMAPCGTHLTIRMSAAPPARISRQRLVPGLTGHLFGPGG